MTDSRTDKLHTAILRDVLLFATDGSMAVQLASGIYRVGPPERPRRAMDIGHQLADAIVAAVEAVLAQEETVQYGARCLSPMCQHSDGTGIYSVRDNRAEVEQFIAGTERFQLVMRRLSRTDWEAVPS